MEWFSRVGFPAHVRGFAAVDLETTGLSPRVAADPDSESSKARRARELGIPLIAEPVFLTMLRRGVILDPLVTNGLKPSGAPARPPLAARS